MLGLPFTMKCRKWGTSLSQEILKPLLLKLIPLLKKR
uniref:Uncharacterized protein n=1 Tax=Siphoviridae sp. ctlHU7 TaxID=2827588 RepID=A0A8S5LHU1_9CAUD|nr:MAG TPA: hypothetical protein [Siphoviridae sp. ctlHU7]DAG56107.1 MAG TPA: hypothetical protein [Bacteriophage sp.]DAM04928.1 MAG TPA: hypothetical protein [Caudoviricetes sp.]DAJ77888.1 MAG TPA: hypothetical protein [Bacteriophage sp.]DAM09092.1 MAG TPA: hypothetical protein [Caudoviricetes sp.]